MNLQAVLVVIVAVAGCAAGYFHSRLQLDSIADKTPVLLSILMAALFVRLARGVPAFPFEKISQHKSIIILEALAHLRAMYAHAFLAFSSALIVSILYSPLIKSAIPASLSAVLSGGFVGMLTWAMATAYLVFRTDMSLFRSQSDAMEEVVSDLAAQAAAKSAETVRINLQRPSLPDVDPPRIR